MSENTYLVVAGHVQKFGDKPAVETKDVNGKTVREFTIKALGTQKLLKVSVWNEFAAVPIEGGDFVSVDGKYSSSTGNNGTVFHNLTANSLFVGGQVTKAPREVVNQNQAAPEAAPQGQTEKPPF